MTSTDSLVADRLYAHLALLERLADYAQRPGEVTPPVIPGLTDKQQKFLATDKGAGAAASWLRAFRDTLQLLREFRAGDLSGKLVYRDAAEAAKDLRSAATAADTAVDAAASRIAFLSERPDLGGKRPQFSA